MDNRVEQVIVRHWISEFIALVGISSQQTDTVLQSYSLSSVDCMRCWTFHCDAVSDGRSLAAQVNVIIVDSFLI